MLPLRQPFGRFKNRIRFVGARILEKIEPPVRNIRSRTQQIHVAVTIKVHRKWRGPQPHAQVCDETRVKMLYPNELGVFVKFLAEGGRESQE